MLICVQKKINSVSKFNLHNKQTMFSEITMGKDTFLFSKNQLLKASPFCRMPVPTYGQEGTLCHMTQVPGHMTVTLDHMTSQVVL